jgi:hypothetical protein
MSLLANTSANFNSSSSKRSYISTSAFNGIIYSYTTTLNTSNFKQEGRLAALTALPSGTTITAANCPAGRILRETGRKLFPGANPGLVQGDSYQGTTVANNNLNKMWVLVFDSVTGLRGFIDPNAPQFAVYNSDRNPAFVDVAETAGGAPTRLGQSVLTNGNVTSAGGLIGYSYNGTPAAVTQATDKSTAVTLNTPTGRITMNNATLNATTSASFTLTNSYISSVNDIIMVSIAGASFAPNYVVAGVATGAGSATITVRNNTAGNLAEAVVLQFVILKGVNLT